ncbi:hypothetical protein [Celeribacter baekdonensis]|uniref:hypothetical protein n=1 Tax=Celeribacter baekdonensis TaxID=875171 RepID=UPI003A9343D4
MPRILITRCSSGFGQVIASAISRTGQIDALVNTAGVGMLNVLEGADITQAREEGLAPS